MSLRFTTLEYNFPVLHELILKSKNALRLGQIHCAILVADNAYENKAYVQRVVPEGEFDLSSIKLTLFGEESCGNFIQWWVRKKVMLLGDIRKKTEALMPHLDNLKRESLRLSQTLSAEKYVDLIDNIVNFCETHEDDILALEEFVLWLREIDELCPCVLFSHPPWSTSQLSDRYLKFNECNESRTKRCTEIVTGLWWHGKPTLGYIRDDIESDWAESNEEYQGPSPITYETAFPQANNKILSEFALYFLKIRDSVDLIRSELLSFSKDDLLKNLEFLRLLISKIVPKYALETQLWDLKEIFSAWRNEKDDKLKMDLACNVAAYANSKGGLLIIGIDDKKRQVIGISDPEVRIRQTRSILERFLEPLPKTIEIFPLPVEGKDGTPVNCIIITIPQTKDVIEVKEVASPGTLKPVREDNGIKYKSYKEVSDSKKGILNDNYLFVRELFDSIYS
jgi:hypothetical protein